jgi:hypothetical protein
MVASLSTIVFQSLRDNLWHGDGVKLGLLASGFSFTELSFFWSSEFLSAIFPLSWIGNLSLRHAKLILLLPFSGFLASLVGPSSAVLGVPRPAWFWTGGTKFYLKGSQDQLWPMNLTSDHIGGPECQYGAPPGNLWCINAGSPPVFEGTDTEGRFNFPPHRGYITMNDRELQRLIHIVSPQYSLEVLAYTAHLASLFLANDNVHKYNIAEKLAKGYKGNIKHLPTG